MTTPPVSRRARSALFKALRAAFRAVPMKESTRDMLRSRFLREFPTVRPLPAQGQVSSTYERRPRVRADERCIGYVEYSEEPLPDPLPATLVAFYLPQFHTIPENDEWWGKGFTEWRNVTRALPQFEGHLQPRLPGDLGFYDLRNPQVMRDQAKLAKTYGLSAFCFYFYWFGGKTLLEEPVRNWLNDKSIDFQYCLCWANENWTRRWDGREDDVLIAQKHSPEDDIAFIEYVADYLRDPRYLRVDGKPMLLLYRPMLLPDPRATAERWRAWCRENGVGEIHLAYVQSFERPDPRDIGFDAAVEFPPNLGTEKDATSGLRLLNPEFAGVARDWRALTQYFINRPPADYVFYRGVTCGWDNEARRPGAGRAFINSSPGEYRDWLRGAIAREPTKAVFINAWNEWAEAAYLEPDAARGYAYLSATRSALPKSREHHRPCVVVHAWHLDVFSDLITEIQHELPNSRVVITCCSDSAEEIRAITAEHFTDAEIVEGPNRGRDMLPFLRVAQRLRSEGEDAVLKLHTKKSSHRSDGEAWRKELVETLLSHGNGRRLHAKISSTSTLGMIIARAHAIPNGDHWGGNQEAAASVCAHLGLRAPSDQGLFAAGSMYWIRLAALDSIFAADLHMSDFESEQGQIDGTFAHALERLVAHVAQERGYEIELTGGARPTGPYRYAPGTARAST
ncbi:glycoside hydrolase family 99-like domain-containing protein [Lysobacter sp. HA18]